MQITLVAAAVLLATSLCACAGDDGDTSGGPSESAPSESETPVAESPSESDTDLTACNTMKVGARIDDSVLHAVENGCYGETIDDIYLNTFVVAECQDGRQLVEHADELFGFVGGVWMAGDVNSSAYKAAEAGCSTE